MRFHYGAIPDAPDFEPDGSWKPLREPGPVLAQCIALPLGVVWSAILAGVWLTLTPLSVDAMMATIDDAPVWVGLLCFVGIIVVHELVHAAVHPLAGRSPHSILGVWPSRGIFYAHFDGEMTRNRLVAILFAPLLVISIVPLGILSAAQISSGGMAWVSVMNCLMACVDIFGSGLLLFQVPAKAIVRNKGWRTFWRRREASVT